MRSFRPEVADKNAAVIEAGRTHADSRQGSDLEIIRLAPPRGLLRPAATSGCHGCPTDAFLLSQINPSSHTDMDSKSIGHRSLRREVQQKGVAVAQEPLNYSVRSSVLRGGHRRLRVLHARDDHTVRGHGPDMDLMRALTRAPRRTPAPRRRILNQMSEPTGTPTDGAVQQHDLPAILGELVQGAIQARGARREQFDDLAYPAVHGEGRHCITGRHVG